MNVNRDLDVRGLNCPLPILRAKKALAEMNTGELLRVIATDQGSVRDFQAFCRQTGHELVSNGETADKELEFILRCK
ncbi:sulfurtransferase TusA family protein [Niveibacterium sp. 24ML]|uniref:sulfurtransferase TusA family protein n=1 Tax=Niveibacterium sp. 24ML TaxID=2985512 RepID=UPI002271ADA1|nr:sulfurtransferase TusA family protein [Niveibacterium sp. 24ML]MCX9157630.1 sulfurtransferase TusA family protein [Niveibacterium sp. 24ML]